MKKISYIICLTAILCSCNNELPIENVQELQTHKSKEDSEILSFKNSEEFLSTIENFDLDNPILTRASSSFVSAENIYEQENNENADNEYIGFLIPDEKYRNFFNKDLEIIINDTLYKATKYGTLFTHISNKSELIKSLENISEFKPLSNNTKHIAFFPQKFGIASYCRQWCTQLMGNSMYRFLSGGYEYLILLHGLFQLLDQIRCLAFVSFNVLCITVYDDIGNDQQQKNKSHQAAYLHK